MIKAARARHETGMRFQITTGSGHALAIDDADGDSAPRPAELLLAAQAGCARPGCLPDALGERWSATARTPAGLAR